MNIAYTFTHLAAIFFDLPFAVLPTATAPWDVLLAVDDLRNLIRGLEVVQDADSWHVVFVVHWKQVADLAKVLEELGYVNIMPVYWHKLGHKPQVMVHQFAPAVEIMITARRVRGSGASAYYDMAPDPAERHNFMEFSATVTPLRDSHSNVYNISRKPSELAEWFFSKFARPGSNVLILGTGAGGDVMGAINLGLNVTAVEKDKGQFDLFADHLLTLSQKHVKKHQSTSGEDKGKAEKRDAPERTAEKAVARPASDANKCYICGTGFGETLTVKCMLCTQKVHVPSCRKLVGVDTDGSKESWCNQCYCHKMRGNRDDSSTACSSSDKPPKKKVKK